MKLRSYPYRTYTVAERRAYGRRMRAIENAGYTVDICDACGDRRVNIDAALTCPACGAGDQRREHIEVRS